MMAALARGHDMAMAAKCSPLGRLPPGPLGVFHGWSDEVDVPFTQRGLDVSWDVAKVETERPQIEFGNAEISDGLRCGVVCGDGHSGNSLAETDQSLSSVGFSHDVDDSTLPTVHVMFLTATMEEDVDGGVTIGDMH